jgi:hypothetical protein
MTRVDDIPAAPTSNAVHAFDDLTFLTDEVADATAHASPIPARDRIADVLDGLRGSADAATSGPRLGQIIDAAALPGLAGGDAALAEIAAKATKPLDAMRAAFAVLRATPKA